MNGTVGTVTVLTDSTILFKIFVQQLFYLCNFGLYNKASIPRNYQVCTQKRQARN